MSSRSGEASLLYSVYVYLLRNRMRHGDGLTEMVMGTDRGFDNLLRAVLKAAGVAAGAAAAVTIHACRRDR